MQRSLDSFIAKPSVPQAEASSKPLIGIFKKRNKGMKGQNSIRLTVSSVFVPQDILTPIFSTK